MSRLTSEKVHIIENDLDAINAAYQVADFALEGRNQRDQQRLLPFAEIDLFSQKGLGGMRIPKQYGGAFVTNKTLAHVFRIINKADSSVGQIPQNQIALLNMIQIMGTEEQKQFIYNEILKILKPWQPHLLLKTVAILWMARNSIQLAVALPIGWRLKRFNQKAM